MTGLGHRLGHADAVGDVGAHQEPPSRDHVPLDQPGHQLAPARGRDVLEAGAHEVEAPGRLPAHDVAHPDPIGPLRTPAPGQGGHAFGQVQAVGLHGDAAGRRPAQDALHQQPVGAAHVEEVAVAGDGVGHRAPVQLPAPGVAAEAGPPVGVVRGQVGIDEAGVDQPVPVALLEPAGGQGPVEPADLLATPAADLLQGLVRGHAAG